MFLLGLVLFCFSASTAQSPEPKESENSNPKPHWTSVYERFHRAVSKIRDKVKRNYLPEFMIIKGNHTIASIQVDTFGAKVLHEADEILLPYRQQLDLCINESSNEFRQKNGSSIERFSWLLDSYVETVGLSIDEYEEPTPINGVKEREVSTDRTIYAYTQMALAYLREKVLHQKKRGTEEYSADKALHAALTDVAKRVYHLDMTQPFDGRELVEKGPESQPILRELATSEGKAQLSLGLAPLKRILVNGAKEAPCRISIPPKTP